MQLGFSADFTRCTMSPSCAVCEKAGDKMKLCGQCKDRCYCSPECQRLDWKTHKTWCQKNAGKIDQRVNQTLKVVGKGIDPAELFAEHPCCKYVAVIDGKGAGVIASDFIPAGEIIVRDQHILCITGDELGLSDIWSESNKPPAKFDRQHELIKEKFERLSESDQAKVRSKCTVLDTIMEVNNWLLETNHFSANSRSATSMLMTRRSISLKNNHRATTGIERFYV